MAEEQLPGLSDAELLKIESDVLADRANDPDLTDEERQLADAQSEQALMNAPFLSVRETFLSTRPGLELPRPNKGEAFPDYYVRLEALVDQYDEEKEKK